MGFYNQFALYSLNIWNNEIYMFCFVTIFTIISFFGSLIYYSYCDNSFVKQVDGGFLMTLMFSILLGGMGAFLGALMAGLWSLVIAYILPFILICYSIYKGKNIINFIKNIKIKNHKKQSKNIIKETINEIKCEEIAKQVYENLKEDFPDIKYEDVLKNIKSKL